MPIKAKIIYDDDTVIGPVESLDPTGGTEGDAPIIGPDGRAHWDSVSAGTDAAPDSAEYIVNAAHANLTSERVLTDTTDIVKDAATAGQMKLNLAATGVSAGTYGDASNALEITVDAKGRITSITEVPISGGAGGARVLSTLSTGLISLGGQETGSFTLSKATVLIRVSEGFGRQSRLRIYPTSAARDADLTRDPETSAISGSQPTGTGISVDLMLTSADSYNIQLDPKAILANVSHPSATTLYYTVDNYTGASTDFMFNLYHTPIES